MSSIDDFAQAMSGVANWGVSTATDTFQDALFKTSSGCDTRWMSCADASVTQQDLGYLSSGIPLSQTIAGNWTAIQADATTKSFLDVVASVDKTSDDIAAAIRRISSPQFSVNVPDFGLDAGAIGTGIRDVANEFENKIVLGALGFGTVALLLVGGLYIAGKKRWI